MHDQEGLLARDPAQPPPVGARRAEPAGHPQSARGGHPDWTRPREQV